MNGLGSQDWRRVGSEGRCECRADLSLILLEKRGFSEIRIGDVTKYLPTSTRAHTDMVETYLEHLPNDLNAFDPDLDHRSSRGGEGDAHEPRRWDRAVGNMHVHRQHVCWASIIYMC